MSKENKFIPFSLERLPFYLAGMKESDLIIKLVKENIKKDEQLQEAKRILKYSMDNFNGYCYQNGDCENCNTKSCPVFAIERCLIKLEVQND